MDESMSLEVQLSVLTAEVEGLRRALDTRPLIDLAKGMVMHRYSCSDEAAFALLRRFSQEHNVKIRDLATAVVARVDGEAYGQVSADAAAVATLLFEPGAADGQDA